MSGWQELPHLRAERGPHRRCGTWCRSSLSGRADALYIVNDALGSFLLRANEVIDQVPMSACGVVCGDWSNQWSAWEQQSWAYLFNTGLISNEEANAWREKVWPIEPDEDDAEDVT